MDPILYWNEIALEANRLRASVDRLATFCAWQLSKRFDSLFSVA
jgi:hypothetical protein